MIRFSAVSKRLGRTQALDDVSLAIPDGSITAILGESGCGKSTLLKHINGLLAPDSGHVQVFGANIDYGDLHRLRRRIGYAVQAVGLFPHLRVYDNITLAARLFAWDPAEMRARVDRLLDLLRLDRELEQRYPHELSGGQQQRVGLARAMMLRPELLLMDEPFSGIDPIARMTLHDEFQAMWTSEPATAVLVTHDAAEAAKLASYLVIMDSGRVIQHGPKTRVLESPANSFVARLFEGIR